MLRCTFADVLCHIRIAHIASSVKTVNDLRKDPLIPSEIIDQVLADQWISLLLNEEGNGFVSFWMDLLQNNLELHSRGIAEFY